MTLKKFSRQGIQVHKLKKKINEITIRFRHLSQSPDSLFLLIPTRSSVLAFNLLIHPLFKYPQFVHWNKTNGCFNWIGKFEQNVQYEWTAAELHKAASSPSKAKQAKSGTEIKHCHSEI